MEAQDLWEKRRLCIGRARDIQEDTSVGGEFALSLIRGVVR